MSANLQDLFDVMSRIEKSLKGGGLNPQQYADNARKLQEATKDFARALKEFKYGQAGSKKERKYADIESDLQANISAGMSRRDARNFANQARHEAYMEEQFLKRRARRQEELAVRDARDERKRNAITTIQHGGGSAGGTTGGSGGVAGKLVAGLIGRTALGRLMGGPGTRLAAGGLIRGTGAVVTGIAAMGAGGLAGGLTAGLLGGVTAAGAALAVLAGAFVIGGFALKGWIDDVLESRRVLAEMSGPMAAALFKNDVNTLLSNMRMGNALAPSTQDLVDSQDRLRQSLEPIRILFGQIENWVLARLADFFSNGLRLINAILAKLGIIADNTNPKNDETNLDNWVNQVERFYNERQELGRRFGRDALLLPDFGDGMAMPRA